MFCQEQNEQPKREFFAAKGTSAPPYIGGKTADGEQASKKTNKTPPSKQAKIEQRQKSSQRKD